MIKMSWCNDSSNDVVAEKSLRNNNGGGEGGSGDEWSCPSCGHHVNTKQQGRRIHELSGLPAGVKFDPTDEEILQHLEGKVKPESHHPLHHLIDEFIPTLEGENGICYTHPENLPGVNKDGQVRHFFHRPSKAYTTGTRKRRKVHTDDDGSETRWHKTGKTRAVISGNKVKGYKKILVLYTSYAKQKKPEKTNWVMHQYHLGLDDDEKEGELVVSKVFYQTQPRQCARAGPSPLVSLKRPPHDPVPYPSSSIISFEHHRSSSGAGGRPTTPSAVIFPFCCP